MAAGADEPNVYRVYRRAAPARAAHRLLPAHRAIGSAWWRRCNASPCAICAHFSQTVGWRFTTHSFPYGEHGDVATTKQRLVAVVRAACLKAVNGGSSLPYC